MINCTVDNTSRAVHLQEQGEWKLGGNVRTGIIRGSALRFTNIGTRTHMLQSKPWYTMKVDKPEKSKLERLTDLIIRNIQRCLQASYTRIPDICPVLHIVCTSSMLSLQTYQERKQKEAGA